MVQVVSINQLCHNLPMISMVTVAGLKPSLQVKLSPCIDSWMFAMVAVVVAHGGGPEITLVKVKTIAPSSLVSLVCLMFTSVTKVN